MAIVNLEARIPLTTSIRAVPFYDGGNVFRRAGDIFNPPDVPPNDLFQANLRALWTHTVGLGLRIKTPIGGEFGDGLRLSAQSAALPDPARTEPHRDLSVKKGTHPLQIFTGVLKKEVSRRQPVTVGESPSFVQCIKVKCFYFSQIS